MTPAQVADGMVRPECGTYAGRQTHNRMKEHPCEACLQAAARYVAYHRFITGFQHHPRACTACGSVFAEHQCGGAR